jgi:glycerophosphoryl diester phosphodiesterase
MFRNLTAGLLLALAVLPGCKKDDASNAGSTSGSVAVATVTAPLSVKRGLLIARALGGIDGLQHTNSLEALRCNHARGFRWFEVDVESTADGELVCFRNGDEKQTGLSDGISNLRASDVDARKYANQYPIPRFSALLAEADRLGDVVLVVDTGEWSQKTEEAVSRALGHEHKHSTHLVLQAYRTEELERVAGLSKGLGAGLMLNLGEFDGDDAKVEEAVRKYPVLAVATVPQRFTPWLAERLHGASVPVLVQTINEHRQIVSLSRAGADGFYTDSYVPFDRLVADSATLMECGKTKASDTQLRPWTERDVMQPRDFKLPKCAQRKSGHIELTDCDERVLIRSNSLAVPAAQPLHVALDVEAGEQGASFWVELVQKERGVLRPREMIALKPKERRALRYDVALPDGSPGAVARLGLGSKQDRLILNRLRIFHGEERSEPAPAEPAPAEDARD